MSDFDRNVELFDRCIRSGHGYYTFLISDYKTFLFQIAPRFSSHSGSKFVWRGMQDPNWELTSSLSRRLINTRTSPPDRSSWIRNSTRISIAHMLTFLEQLRGLTILDSSHNKLHNHLQEALTNPPQTFLTTLRNMDDDMRLRLFELVSLGQHFSLATPFLDWTRIPAIALFFAFSDADPSRDDVGYRVVYALNRKISEEISPPFESYGDEDLSFLGSLGHNNPRIVGQSGLFTFVPAHLSVERWIVKNCPHNEKRPALLRFLIRNTERQSCLQSLDHMGINARSLLPDKLGASLYSNYHLDQFCSHD